MHPRLGRRNVPKTRAALLAVLLIPGLVLADHFKFIVSFQSGSLDGEAYTGYFTTATPAPGIFTPDAAHGSQLLSLSIKIDGTQFTMQDDHEFPSFPYVRMYDPGYVDMFDYDARTTNIPSLRALWMVRRNLGEGIENSVVLRRWIRGELVVESTGVIFDILPISEREIPPEPNCLPCHSRMTVPRR